jgi:hypothetical protein
MRSLIKASITKYLLYNENEATAGEKTTFRPTMQSGPFDFTPNLIGLSVLVS